LLASLGGCSAAHETDARACRVRSTGIGIGTTINLCPAIVSIEVKPTAAVVGSVVLLGATVNDPDSPVLTYSWTPSSGSVADPTAEKTTYRCSTPGVVLLAFTVSDGECGDKETVAVDCTPCATDAGACGQP
jgi:hypothetical protein